MNHSVAITGLGIVSCLGTGAKKATEALKKGKSGIREDLRRTELGLRSALTGVIDDFIPPSLDKKFLRTMTDFGIQAYGATLEAIQMAGWNEDDIRSVRTGMIIGNDSSTLASVKQVDIARREKSTFPIGASLVFQALNSTVTMNLSSILGIRGASWTLSGACASGGHAVGQAGELIASGRQDRIICGGVQELNWESVVSFDATNAFAIRRDDPARASRPFDEERNGLVPSGGAAIILLERYDLAQKRGAAILGRLLAYSFSSDGYHLAIPSGEGLRWCMEDCLKRGKALPDQVDYICAHATSTPVGDAVEAQAIYSIFGKTCPWVSSTKAMTGHEMWMAGAAQVVYSILMGIDGFIAPNINFAKQEKGAAPLKIARETIDAKPKIILCNSAGFGGTNSCLLLGSEP